MANPTTSETEENLMKALDCYKTAVQDLEHELSKAREDMKDIRTSTTDLHLNQVYFAAQHTLEGQEEIIQQLKAELEIVRQQIRSALAKRSAIAKRSAVAKSESMPLLYAGIARPISIHTLASHLADATLDEQRNMLGDSLFPLVENQLKTEAAAAKRTSAVAKTEDSPLLDAGISQPIRIHAFAWAVANATQTEVDPNVVSKVTGMLLECDQTEVLHLIESPDALKARVAEAMEVLRNADPKLYS